ncbi:MAG: YwiC-like family protein [Candidatus Hydrogenedentes bacterium]|nr:YwiC-like family protein [Candidatus Hydrogenedentota bacterium]
MDSEGRYFRWKFAIPPEKGGWIWWIGPLAVGIAAAGTVRPGTMAVVVGAFAAFCVRQPLTLFIKSYRLASLRVERGPAGFWVLLYGAICALVAIALLLDGNLRVLALAIPAIPVFAWHFYLVARGNERRQMLRDVLAAMALALSGTAAYWSCGGGNDVTAILVWLLPGLHSSASVVHMFLRLDQRRWEEAGALSRRLRLGTGPFAHHAANVVFACAFWAAGYVSILGVVAFVLCFADGVWAILVPQVGHTPKQLGMRQLAVSAIFSVLMCPAFWTY